MKKLLAAVAISALALTTVVPTVQAAERTTGIHKVAPKNVHKAAAKKKTKTTKSSKKKTPTKTS